MGILENTACILCTKTTLETVQQLKTEDISTLYKNRLHVEISEEFKDNETINYVKCTSCNLHFFTPICNGSANFYELLQEKQGFYYNANRYEFFFAKKHIKATDKVLEIGAGSGYFASLLNAENYVGLEYNDKAIEDAATRNVTLINQSIQDFSKTHKTAFDIACNFQVLEHVPNPNEFINASLATLKKGGLLIIGVPSANSILTNNKNHVLNFPPHHITRWYNDTCHNFANIFDVEIVAIHNEPVTEKLYKNLVSNKITDRVLNLFNPKEHILVNDKRALKIDGFVRKIVSKLGLSKNIAKKDQIFGESVILVLRKK
ncbi:putative S-adenosylmethionine-dependent methyltransferase/MSMEI_2290 [Kordia antarctica]|uniref:Putative S-adenosylmethionine-dependent methyltransferase/MSMEI_2290 n=1 Tax=Kordia antarctica TaxID=1218801 RepID=A0A7L4ZFM9_9FLAO|nr:class I SAM-dependent methyltransferase [Kordia antarctica]QHI35241.1 putative S-adenosylmethionine-dependent methyltransferase/MSMEI_2290 [Kordia antarctica]